MGQKLYTQDEGGIRVTSKREGHVRIPNYVFDIWMPLIGSDAIGVYGVYCRLEMHGSVKRITMRDLAASCRIGVTKLKKINDKLEECGFIVVKHPTGHMRLMHWTTEIVVLDPPRSISEALMKSYSVNGKYKPLTIWLVSESPETPNGFSTNTNQFLDKTPNGNANIEDLDLKTSEDIEEEGANAPPPPHPAFLPLALEKMTVKDIKALALTDDQWRAVAEMEKSGRNRSGILKFITARLNRPAPAVERYREITEYYPHKSLWKGITKAVGSVPADIDRWERVITNWIGCGWNITNVSGMLGYYARNEIPLTGNGRNNGNQGQMGHRRNGRTAPQPEIRRISGEKAALFRRLQRERKERKRVAAGVAGG